MEPLSSKQKEERLRLIKDVYEQRLARRTLSGESVDDATTNYLRSELAGTQSVGRATTPTQSAKQDTTNEELNGGEKIVREQESKTTHGTPGSKALSVRNNLPTESSTDRSTGLKEHLRRLREASSQSMSLLDSTSEHLSELMTGLREDFKTRNPHKANGFEIKDMINQTVSVASQLHKNMKLKLDTVKVLHKISTDIGDS